LTTDDWEEMTVNEQRMTGGKITDRAKFERLLKEVKGHVDILRLSGVEFVPAPSVKVEIVEATPPKPRPEKAAGTGIMQPSTTSATAETPAPESLRPENKTGAPDEIIIKKKEYLKRVARAVAKCERCGLNKTRTFPVPGEGNPDADLVFVGEAPGYDEDRSGRPFVGRAGRYLTKIIAWMGFSREQVFICNTLKCRPPGNRNPSPAEMEMCRAYLEEQLEILEPKVICALGAFGARAMTGQNVSIGKLRGKTYYYYDIPVICTYHPAYIIRNPTEDTRNKVKEDLQRIIDGFFPGCKPDRKKGE